MKFRQEFFYKLKVSKRGVFYFKIFDNIALCFFMSEQGRQDLNLQHMVSKIVQLTPVSLLFKGLQVFGILLCALNVPWIAKKLHQKSK